MRSYPPTRGRDGQLSERDYSATDAQRSHLRRLLVEALFRLYDHRTGLNPEGLESVSAAEACRAITTLKAAKDAGWQSKAVTS